MNYTSYQLYCDTRRMIGRAESCENEHDNEALAFLDSMKSTVSALENLDSDYLRRYDMEQKMYQSFTSEQRNFICAQIGWWYLMMKPLLEGTHNLGYMKEKLKTMICGD